MKRILLLAALAALLLPATTLAKGPSEASITGPGLDRPITITGAEAPGSPLMTFAEEAGFFPAVFDQQPNPMLPARPKGNLGPKFRIDYTVPGPEGDTFEIVQDLYPYARPDAVTYTKPGQKIFDVQEGTRGGWFESAYLRQVLIDAGLPKTRPTVTSSSAGFLSTGRLGAAVGGALLLAAAAWLALRHRPRRDAA